MAEESKFKVGDRVISPHFGEGIITGIDESEDSVYPIHVKWIKTVPPYHSLGDCFTTDGRYTVSSTDSEFDIVSMEDKKGTKFHLGDRVYFKSRGYGTIIELIQNKPEEYPIVVKWDDTNVFDTFTSDGYLWSNHTYNAPHLIIHYRPDRFHVGDRVFAPVHGYGVVVEIKDDGREYPIEVTWDEKQHGCSDSVFTLEGYAVNGLKSEDDDITLVENDSLKGDKEMDEKSKKFKVGDRVFSSYYGFGVVYSVSSVADSVYPVGVQWDNPQNNAKEPKPTSLYTADGKFRVDGSEWERDIYPLKVSSVHDEEAVDPMIETPDKNVDDATNPSHYKVECLPEAIDIINHLMHRCQLEGFLWGNIIKYAYRYGRKGDKAETAGKIEWYARQLKELGECESEECEKNDSKGTHGVGEKA